VRGLLVRQRGGNQRNNLVVSFISVSSLHSLM
jgi:hypothetical protein